jgi:hypothetical protein
MEAENNPQKSLRSSWKEGQMDHEHTLPGWNPEAWNQLQDRPVLPQQAVEFVRLKCRISSALDDIDALHVVRWEGYGCCWKGLNLLAFLLS